jgi:SAM-dependent methyltransferase
VPDPAETRKLLDFWPGLNAYGLLHAFYTEKNLRQLLTGHGFVEIQRLENVHFYPAIVLKARKGDPFVPGRAYQKLPELKGGWKILDIGPGHFPLASATHFLDKKRFPEVPEEAPVTIFDLNSGQNLPFDDDSFDFIYCSHVLEHLERPIAVLEEIQRIGERGYVEIPSVCLDFAFKHGQTHPKWACWGSGGVLIFIEKTKGQNRLFLDFNRVFGGFFHSAVHGKTLTAVQRAIRFNFWENQHLLNISASWDKKKGDFPIQAMEIRLKE